tara:strand:- start:8575 stop:10101 length:1527 start_codon:yes stop_codon:yes gene_type:complete
MPGVNVTTAVRSGPVGAGDIVAGQVFMVGEAERGPTAEPTLLRSFGDYTTYYGNYKSTNLYAHVKTYFDEGGTRCHVQRVVGSGAAAGSVSLASNSGASAGMTITASSVGAWASNLTVAVLAADSAGYRLQFALDSATLLTTRDLATVADGINFVNASGIKHLLVASTTLTAAQADNASNNLDIAVAAAVSGSASDGSAVSNTEVVAALAIDDTGKLSPNLNTGAVCAPGRTGAAIWAALAAHAGAFNRIALCSFGAADSAATAKTDAATYYADANASHMAFYWPYVKVAAPAVTELATGESTIQGATITISPEAYTAAARSRAVQNAGGPWRVGAGAISAGRTLKGLASDVTPATGDALDAARVNAIRKVGDSIRVYGARSVSNDEANWRYISMRDTMNYIVFGVEAKMEEHVFSVIDGRGNTFGVIRAAIKAFLDPIRVAGGLYEAYDDSGNPVDAGYSVRVDSTINPATQLATGLIKAQVGIRVSGVADLIDITITKSNLSAPLI